MFIFSNLAMSLDGKISTSERVFFPLGSSNDLAQMAALRRRCDAILIGASTFRCYRKPSVISNVNEFGELESLTETGAQPINVILSSDLEGISPSWEFFEKKDLKRVLLVGHKTPKSRIRKFSDTSEVVVLKKPTLKQPIALQIIQVLEERGVQNLLVEGGGGVMWDFVSVDRIDEYHVTLTPNILGGGSSPTLVDGVGFDTQQILKLQLRQCRVVGDELFLTYARKVS